MPTTASVGLATLFHAWYPPRMEHPVFELTEFSPGDVAKITGLSPAMQRDWRRRGFVPSNEGARATFDPFEVASLLGMKLLADQKIGPAATSAIAALLGSGIVGQALRDFGAWTGDHKDALTWVDLPEAKPLPQHLIHAAKDADFDISHIDLHWDHRSHWLSVQCFRRLGYQMIPAQFFAWFADGTYEWQREPNDFFQGASYDLRYAGGVIVLDQMALASMLIERCRRPLVRVTLPRDESGVVVAPVEVGRPVPLPESDRPSGSTGR